MSLRGRLRASSLCSLWTCPTAYLAAFNRTDFPNGQFFSSYILWSVLILGYRLSFLLKNLLGWLKKEPALLLVTTLGVLHLVNRVISLLDEHFFAHIAGSNFNT